MTPSSKLVTIVSMKTSKFFLAFHCAIVIGFLCMTCVTLFYRFRVKNWALRFGKDIAEGSAGLLSLQPSTLFAAPESCCWFLPYIQNQRVCGKSPPTLKRCEPKLSGSMVTSSWRTWDWMWWICWTGKKWPSKGLRTKARGVSHP